MPKHCGQAYPDMPRSADLVMYWWRRAADLVRAGKAQRFGLITTNSLPQTFNRRVVAAQLDAQTAAWASCSPFPTTPGISAATWPPCASR